METVEAKSQTLQDRVELLVFGYIRIFIEDKLDNIPMECKIICKTFVGGLIDTKILSIHEERLLLSYVKQQTKSEWKWKLLLRATDHDNAFSKDTFYKYCKDKTNTVIIVHNDRNRVFGGYTPCAWKYNTGLYQTDETLTTFLFLLRSNNAEDIRLMPLKESCKKYATCHLYSNTAFDFGRNQFYLFNNRIYTYNIDTFENCGQHLGGGQSESTIPKEIEIYQLQ